MRFLVFSTPEALSRARPPVRAFLAFAALALVAFAALRVLQGGLTPAGVEARYLAGGDPMPAVALWEEVHSGAFLYGFLVFTLGSLLAVSPAPAWPSSARSIPSCSASPRRASRTRKAEAVAGE